MFYQNQDQDQRHDGRRSTSSSSSSRTTQPINSNNQHHQQQHHHHQKEMSKLPVYLLEDVSVEYGSMRALRGIDLTIEKGEMIFLTGRSGAGKTTLLKLLAQEIVPTTGQIIMPKLITGKKAIFTAVVFQDLRLLGNLTGEENLMYSYDSSIYHSKSEFVSDYLELAKILDIKDRLHLKMKDANGGLKQKVAIIRALLTRPDILIADEPTSSLDTENARRLFDVFSLYNQKRQMTLVWATHNRELIKNFNGRILHLDAGRLIYSGSACFI